MRVINYGLIELKLKVKMPWIHFFDAFSIEYNNNKGWSAQRLANALRMH